MNTTIISMDPGVDEPGSPAPPVLRRRTAMPFVVAVVLTLCTAGSCPAVDQPPQEPEQQRAWLVGHLITDMEALGVFDGTTLAKVPGIVNALTDEQVALVSQFYYLTRAKTLQDASLYAMQQQGYSDEQVNEAKAAVADVLTAMHDEIVACREQFILMPRPLVYLANIIYASVPGWCCRARCYVPDWYYDDGYYVGPCFDSTYAGVWAVPVCRTFFDRHSHFYSIYHAVPDAVHARHSINVAHHRAEWFRHQGDWRSVVAHDRLTHNLPSGHRSPPPRIAASASRHVGAPAIAYDRRSAPARAGSKQVARHQGFQSHAIARPPKTQHQVAKTHTSHASTGQPKAQHRAAKPQASRVSAPHPHAAHSSPKPQAHAVHAHPQPQHAARTHSNSGQRRHG